MIYQVSGIFLTNEMIFSQGTWLYTPPGVSVYVCSVCLCVSPIFRIVNETSTETRLAATQKIS